VGNSKDPDGTISSRVIDFGDGTTPYTFPSDLTMTSVSHTYVGNNTFTATLTVTDSLGPTSTATQVITVGSGGDDEIGALLLKTLALKINPNPTTSSTGTTPAATDQLTLSGQIVLPNLLTAKDLNNGGLFISLLSDANLVSPITDAAYTDPTVTITAANNYIAGQYVTISGLAPDGYNGQVLVVTATPTNFTFSKPGLPALITMTGTVNAGLTQVSTVSKLGINGKYTSKTERFSLTPFRAAGAAVGTYSFTYSFKGDLSKLNPIDANNDPRIILDVSLEISTSIGRRLYYGSGLADASGKLGLPKMAVVDVKITKNKTSLSLVRR